MRVFFCLLLFLCFSCSNTDEDSPSSCIPVNFDSDKFNSSSNFGLDLIEYNLEDLCLNVKLGIGGCDDDHLIEMVSNGAVAPSDPTIVVFDFYDNNPQLCEAYFVIERAFDLTEIPDKFNQDVIVSFRNNQGSVQIDK